MEREFWDIIPQSYRRRGIGVALTIFVRALLNFVGVATLLPVLMLLLNPEGAKPNGLLDTIRQALGIDSDTNFTIIVCGLALCIILLKNISVIRLYSFERDYIFSLYKHLSKALYATYYRRGLHFIKHSNSTILTRNINSVCLIFVSGYLKPFATILGEGLLLVLVVATLVWFNPIVALLAIAVILPIGALFYLLLRRNINNLGKQENELQRRKSRIVAETFRGYADIEISGAYELMSKRFDEAMNDIISLRKRHATLAMLPQMFTETGLMLGLILFVVVNLILPNKEVALMFGVFAVATIRLIPSLRSIMTNWSTIRFNRFTLDTLKEIEYDNLEDVEYSDTRINFSDSIVLRNISFKFDDSDSNTITDFSLSVHKGEHIGIRGASGIGKTTLFNILLGLYRPTSGEIVVDGERLSEANIRSWQNSIGYVPQSVFITEGSILENIVFGHSVDNIDYNRINEVIEIADLKRFIDTLPEGINTKISEQGENLSGGQRQRIGIARALYKNCDILLLDEATSSLDGKTEESINTAIERLSNSNNALTIILIAHRETTLQYCDRIITLE